MPRPLAVSLLTAALAALLLGACGGDDGGAADASTEPDARPPQGTISMTWRVESGGADSSCADVAAQFVEIELVRQGEAAGEADSFNCATGEAATRQVNVGVYDLRLDLLDASAQSLLAAQVVKSGIEVTADSDSPIGEVVFDVE